MSALIMIIGFPIFYSIAKLSFHLSSIYISSIILLFFAFLSQLHADDNESETIELPTIKSLKSDMSILAISGFQCLNYLPSIFINTKILGIVNKECIVSAGHLFNNLNLILSDI